MLEGLSRTDARRPAIWGWSLFPLILRRSLDRLVLSRWHGSAEEHRAIIRGLIAVAAFAFLGKLAGAAKEMAVAWRYGVGAEVDAYVFVFNLVSWPIAIWFSVLNVILIPLVARTRQESTTALRLFRGELLAFTLALGLLFAGIGLVGMPPLLQSRWLGLPPATARLAVEMVPVLAWVIVPGLLAGLYSIWMMGAGRHANTLYEGLPALAVLVGVLLSGGIEPLIWGTLAGMLLRFAFVAAPMRVPGERHRPTLSLSASEWSPFWQAFGVLILGQGVMSLTTLTDQFFAARLPEGAISTLGFAGRIVALIVGIVATAVTRATLPVFARTRAVGTRDLRMLAVRWAAALFVVGIVALAVGWLLAPWVVKILYQRGTFTAEDTQRVTHLLRFGLVQLPFYFSSLVLVSMHASYGRYRLLVMTGVLGLGTKLVASILLLPPYGVGGLMLAQAAVYAANGLLLARANSR